MSLFSLDMLFGDIGEALKEATEDFMYENILPVTPLSDDNNRGELRRSLKVKKINNRECIIYCDESIAPYSKFVHEMPNDTTKWTTTGTGNKFIERPLLEKGNIIYDKLYKKIQTKSAFTRGKYKVYKLGNSNVSFTNYITGGVTKV